jgi:hypothetical protein
MDAPRKQGASGEGRGGKGMVQVALMLAEHIALARCPSASSMLICRRVRRQTCRVELRHFLFDSLSYLSVG